MKNLNSKLSIKKFTVGALDSNQQAQIVGGSFGCSESTCGGTANGCGGKPQSAVCPAPPLTSSCPPACNTVGPQVSCQK